MKMKRNYTTVDEYIATFPGEVQEGLQQVRAAIRKAAPRAEETIKYGMPTFVSTKNLIFFAAFKNHISLFSGKHAIENFKDDLANYKLAKGTIQFPLDKPVPAGLITKITKFNLARLKGKS